MDRISVAICTRNRARLLQGTLESLCRARPLRRLGWEVVVVLNDCSDRSPDVVEGFTGRLPIVGVVEAQAGLSRARNKAIDQATGDVIVWIDDDVRVEPDWLSSYEDAFLRWPDASLFGGPIVPEFEGTPPAWLEQALRLYGSAFAERRAPAPDAPIRIEDDYPPYGANFAVRMPVQRRFRYDVRLGARPGRMVMLGEETQVIDAILAAGGSGRWVHSAVVRHIMPAERQTTGYLRSYFQGSGWLKERRAQPEFRPNLLGRARDLCAVAAAELRYRALRAVASPQRWIPALVDAAAEQGRWKARYRRDSRDAPA
jgi:glycosyltransferase involved in cell wall biosynthesis